MTVNPIEAGVGDVWYAKQSALGTIAASNAAGTVHLRKVGENVLKAAVTHGSEEWVDGQVFGSPQQFVDKVGGDVGSVTFQGQIETSGLMFAQVLAVDVVTGTTPDYTHTITSAGVAGPYGTWRQKAGSAIGPWRDAFWDSKVNRLVFNCGQDQKTMHLEAAIMALKAGEVFSTDPTAADSGTDSFRWDEAAGAVTIAGTAYDEIDGETLEIDRKLEPAMGQALSPIALVPGKGEINSSFSAMVTDNTIPLPKTALYGTSSPADGTRPGAGVNYLALESTYTRSSVRSLKITRPKVEMRTEDWEIGPRAEGGKIPVTFGGRCLKSGATPAVTVVAKTGDSAAYV
jgi:hypothetical protein